MKAQEDPFLVKLGTTVWCSEVIRVIHADNRSEEKNSAVVSRIQKHHLKKGSIFIPDEISG